MFVRTNQCFCFLVIFASVSIIHAQQQPEINPSEYQVYDALFQLMRFPKPDPNVVIGNTTLNSGCGPNSGNPVLLNGCGMLNTPSIDEIREVLTRSWPQMAQSAWDDLVRKSTSSTTLQDSLKSPWPHRVVDLKAVGSLKAVDGAIFLSRVGFNPEHNQAVVYVLFFSYMKQVPTSGTFFLFI